MDKQQQEQQKELDIFITPMINSVIMCDSCGEIKTCSKLKAGRFCLLKQNAIANLIARSLISKGWRKSDKELTVISEKDIDNPDELVDIGTNVYSQVSRLYLFRCAKEQGFFDIPA